jgi:Amidohydrolase family
MNMRKLLATLVISTWATVAYAQKADLIVTNAKIVTLDSASTIAQALAVREGRIVAVGGNDAVEGLVGSATRRVDAGGRTVIPGLIDSHIHAVRAGLTYATEVNWIGARTIGEAMDRLRQAGARRPYLCDRGKLDRCKDHRRSDGPVASGGQGAPWILDHRGGRLERIAICREAAAKPGRGDVRSS